MDRQRLRETVMRATRLLAIGVALLAISCGGGARATAQRIKIGVVPMGTTHQYWLSIHAGALRAAEEAGVELLWPTPFRDGDVDAQIEAARDMRRRGAAAVALAPIDPLRLVGTVDELGKAGLKVLIFDSRLDARELPYVGSDSREAGRQAGRHLAAAVGGKGGILMLRPETSVVSGNERILGFLEAIAPYPEMTVIGEESVGGLLEDAFVKSHLLLKAVNAKAGGTVAGIFCPNETTTIGMLRAVENLGLEGKVHVVGFDTSPMLANLLEDGKISALVVQHSDEMGYRSVQSLVRMLRGETVEPRTLIEARMVTPGTTAEPQVRKLLKPDLMLNRNPRPAR